MKAWRGECAIGFYKDTDISGHSYGKTLFYCLYYRNLIWIKIWWEELKHKNIKRNYRKYINDIEVVKEKTKKTKKKKKEFKMNKKYEFIFGKIKIFQKMP